MNSFRIPLEKTGSFPKLFLDYIHREEKLNSFYKYSPSIDSFEQAINDISSQKFNRKLIVNVITEQYLEGNCQLPVASCQLLFDENTFTVCTGHQLCLFTGPLYFIYKIISTINLAEELKKRFPDYNFIPVYWMVSEDHDFEEVNHINLFGKRIEWKTNEIDSPPIKRKRQDRRIRFAKGRIRLGEPLADKQYAVGKLKTESLRNTLDELKMLMGDSGNAKELLEIFHNAYLKQPDLSSATRYLVNEFFGKYGLVIIDANDKRLKNEMKEIFSDEIENQTSFKLISRTIQELSKLGYKAQVNPREINLFLLKENERLRIENKPEASCQLPEAISPNVVTRPLYQQKILPNIAYIGGPAEIAYWLEYKIMFEQYKIFFPVLIPRNSALIIDKNSFEKFNKSGMHTEDFFLPIHEITAKYISGISEKEFFFNEEKEKLRKIYTDITENLSFVDSTLVPSAQAELRHHIKSLENLEKKLLRAIRKKNESTITGLEKIKQKLFPDNELQERHENFIPYYLKYKKSFFDLLKQNLNPFDFRFTILSEKE